MCGYDPSVEGNNALTEAILPLLVDGGKSEQDLQGMIDRNTIMDSCMPKEFPGAWGVVPISAVLSRTGPIRLSALGGALQRR